MGLCYKYGDSVAKNVARTLAWFRKAAEQGHLQATYWIADAYCDGEGVRRDRRKAVRLYKKIIKLAESEDHSESGDALMMLGICHHNGEGVKQDTVKSVRLYRRAARVGNSRAMFLLGRCYADGQGVGHSDRMAMKWFKKSRASGETEATREIAKLRRRNA